MALQRRILLLAISSCSLQIAAGGLADAIQNSPIVPGARAGQSLRRRVAYSLAIVRLILVR